MKSKKLQKLGFLGSFAIFIPASILIYVMTTYLIPYLSEITGQEVIFFWFVVAGLGIFTPLLITGFFMLRAEGCSLSYKTWVERLRFRKITKRDLLWTFGGLVLIGIFSTLALKGLEMVIGKFDHSPPFMSFEPLTSGRYWLLLVWFPYWILNIMGEEIFWRGFLQKKLMKRYGDHIGWIAGTLIYGLVHIWSMNFMLVGAAMVAGAFWGFLYMKFRNVSMLIISHAVWTFSIFVLWPIR